MNAFFYAPTRLPRTYALWIARLAAVDPRLVHALRQIRFGNFIYGKDTGYASLLGSMAKDLGLPEELGDPSKTIPIPCILVHHGISESCESHAGWRFGTSLAAAAGVYAPIQALILAKRLSSKSRTKTVGELASAAAIDTFRSSAFLATFISLFYYCVCLSRTGLGPRLFPKITPLEWDNGLDIAAGCWGCGWSILWEIPKRQTELMLFVAPRALGVITGRKYPESLRWREETVFALSVATLLTMVQERKQAVRGVLGGLLGVIMS
jgi:hypothetical protein